jgi:predicted nucleotide-binding protein
MTNRQRRQSTAGPSHHEAILEPASAIARLEKLRAEAARPYELYAAGEAARESWKSRVLTVVSRSLGPGSELADKLREVSYSLSAWFDGTPDSAFADAFVDGVGRATGYIEAAIFELSLLQEAEERRTTASKAPDETALGNPDPRALFVVHGRNAAARNAIFEYLRALGLMPMEWAQAVAATGRPSPYIGDVLTAAFSRAQAVLVLFTPDDEAQLRLHLREPADPRHEVELTPQARPNVLFEAGMAMAWDENRTVLVELGKCRPFSDIAGRHLLRLDASSERRQELAQRLRAAGLAVDVNGTDWHTAGDFDQALQADASTD